MVTGSNCSNCSHNTYKTDILFIIIERGETGEGGGDWQGSVDESFFLCRGWGCSV